MAIKEPFEAAVKFTLREDIEGGFVNDPDDSGGPTNKGITIHTAKDNNLDLDKDGDVDIDDVKLIDHNVSLQVYKNRYWNPLTPDDLDPKLAIAAFDTAVNCGVARAKRWLDITLAKGEDHYYFLNLRMIYYADLIQKRPVMAKYKNGWYRRVNELKKYLDIIDQKD